MEYNRILKNSVDDDDNDYREGELFKKGNDGDDGEEDN